MKSTPALEMQAVTYAIDDKKILDSVSWKVQKGEHWAILGPNGAGKTTLLKIVCGYLWPNRGGKVYRQGKELQDLRELRRSIGWVTSKLNARIPPREVSLKTVVSGKFAQIGLREMFWNLPTSQDYIQARKNLSDLGCEDLANVQFGSLSQGEQQKVLIARARMTEPYLIILDDPCAGMDPGSRESFLLTLQELALFRKDPTLIYVTHHVEEIMPAFKKTMIIKDGKVIKTGYTKEIINPETIKQLYGITTDVIKKNGRYWLIN